MRKYIVAILLTVIGVLVPPVGLIMLGALCFWAWKRYNLSKKVGAKVHPVVEYVKKHDLKIVEKAPKDVA
jgi:hypothetical protein